MINREETPGKKLETLDWWHIPSGLGVPQDPPEHKGDMAEKRLSSVLFQQVNKDRFDRNQGKKMMLYDPQK